MAPKSTRSAPRILSEVLMSRKVRKGQRRLERPLGICVHAISVRITARHDSHAGSGLPRSLPPGRSRLRRPLSCRVLWDTSFGELRRPRLAGLGFMLFRSNYVPNGQRCQWAGRRTYRAAKPEHQGWVSAPAVQVPHQGRIVNSLEDNQGSRTPVLGRDCGDVFLASQFQCDPGDPISCRTLEKVPVNH
jgi:hypothetical protein